MATRATFTSGTFQKLQGDPSTILKTITFHTSYKEVSNRSFVLKKMLTSPKMFGLKHMNFEFPPTLDQKNAPPHSWSEGFPLRPWKKRKTEEGPVFCWWSPVGKLMICGVFFWDWDSNFRKTSEKCSMFFLYPASSPEFDPAVIEQRYALDHSMYPGSQDLTKTSKFWFMQAKTHLKQLLSTKLSLKFLQSKNESQKMEWLGSRRK